MKERRFFPSNGTRGMMFVENFCTNCIHEKFMHTRNHDDKQCEIYNNSVLNDRPCLNKDLKFDGWEWFYNAETSEAECKQYKYWDWEGGENDPPEPPDPDQLLMFTFDEKVDKLLKGVKQLI